MDNFVVNFKDYNSFNQNESVQNNYMNYKDFNENKIENISQKNNDPNKVCECYIDNNYPVDIETNVPPELRWTDANTQAPHNLKMVVFMVAQKIMLHGCQVKPQQQQHILCKNYYYRLTHHPMLIHNIQVVVID